MSEVAGDTSQTVLRALALLEDVSSGGQPAQPQILASRAGLSLPTTLRLLRTLLGAGYLDKDGRRYVLGPKIAELYRSFELYLQPLSRHLAALRWVAEFTEETAFLSDWHDGEARVCAVVEGVKSVHVNGIHIGMTGHSYARAAGKVLLAFGPLSRQRAYLDNVKFEPKTPQTITSREGLELELRTVASLGYAVDHAELFLGVCCVAVPLEVGPDGARMALAVTVPVHQFSEDTPRLLDALRASAERVDAHREVFGGAQQSDQHIQIERSKGARPAAAGRRHGA